MKIEKKLYLKWIPIEKGLPSKQMVKLEDYSRPYDNWFSIKICLPTLISHLIAIGDARVCLEW